MRIINMDRGQGKTTYMMYESAKLNIPIVCASETQKNLIVERANKLKLQIPEPILIDDLKVFKDIEIVLIDELELVLKKLLRNSVRVIEATMSGEVIEMSKTTKK